MLFRNCDIKEIRFKRSTISYVGQDGRQEFKNEVLYAKYPNGVIHVSETSWKGFPREIFTVENDSDVMTDYFDNDRMDVPVDHPAYPWVYLGWLRQEHWRHPDDKNIANELKHYRVEKFDYEIWNKCVDYQRKVGAR